MTDNDKFVFNFPPIKHREEWTLRDYADKVLNEAGEAFGSIIKMKYIDCEFPEKDAIVELLDVIHAAESTLRFMMQEYDIITLRGLKSEVIRKNRERGYYK